MNRRFTQGALIAAAAMTLSLASPVSAQASESNSASFGTTAAPTAAVTPAQITRNPGAHPTVTRLVVGRGTLYYSGNTYVPAAISYNIPEGWSMIPTATLTKGSRRSGIELFDGNSVKIPSAWAAGKYRVSNITFRKYDGTASYVAPNATAFQVRQGLYSGGGIRIIRKGKKLTFKVQKIRAFNGSRYVALKTAKVQVKKGKKWKTLKTVKLNRSGNKNFSIKKKGKRNYRLYVPTTSVVQGAVTRAIKI